MDNIMNHYQAVLADLQFRRNRCQKEMLELDQTIAGIRNLLSASASLFVGVPVSVRTEESAPDPKKSYAGMSVRWAILKLLSEDVAGSLKSSEIAARLVNGGIVSKGKDFAANVSAVISNMVKERRELESAEDNTYRLADNGRLAWAAIKHSPKYTNRAVSATLQ